jgi:NAD+ synthase (glutamine-hydrolysing)
VGVSDFAKPAAIKDNAAPWQTKKPQILEYLEYMSTFIAAMAQINPLVGDIDGNCQLMIDYAWRAQREHQADLVVFPELCLTGYPPEDLLLRPSLQRRVDRALMRFRDQLPAGIAVVLGFPEVTAQGLYNAAAIFCDGQWVLRYRKQCLPNYRVFDEKRYFIPGHDMPVWDFRGQRIALCICEDIWQTAPAAAAKAAGANVLIALNASPFHSNKQPEREAQARARSQDNHLAVLYVNAVGGQDELVFDGQSFALSAEADLLARAPAFVEGLFPVSLQGTQPAQRPLVDLLPPLAAIYQALVLGVRDYVNKNRFPAVVLGLSGGIDSALTLAIAVDALGAERVSAVMMPYTYTSDMSQTDAALQAQRMGVAYQSLSIEPVVAAFTATLAPAFARRPQDKTEENLQARARGVLLMALSNKTGSLVLTTGNKSEMSVGYATLYGDMAGGLDVLKDVLKTQVFALARYRNSLGDPVIPERVITRPPSAELAPDQKDEDSLPPYPVLDAILAAYIEQDASASDIVAQGYDEQTVNRVLRMVDINEYKRRQAAIGIRISQRGFGRDRRYPITNAWPIGD